MLSVKKFPPHAVAVTERTVSTVREVTGGPRCEILVCVLARVWNRGGSRNSIRAHSVGMIDFSYRAVQFFWQTDSEGALAWRNE